MDECIGCTSVCVLVFVDMCVHVGVGAGGNPQGRTMLGVFKTTMNQNGWRTIGESGERVILRDKVIELRTISYRLQWNFGFYF